MSITESFAAELLWREVEEDAAAPPGSPIAIVTADAVIDATLTWEKQKAAYNEWFAISPNWTPVKYLANARNAAAHGLGQLTRRQMRKRASTVSLIAGAHIIVTKDQIQITDANLEDAAVSCRTFIEEIDRMARQRRASQGVKSRA